MVFFSYRTKHESPGGDQFWKFSRKCSIFGRISDQWVAISSPGLLLSFSQERVKVSKSANSPSYPLILSYSYQNNIYFNLLTQFSQELTSDTQLDPRWFNLSYFEFHIILKSKSFLVDLPFSHVLSAILNSLYFNLFFVPPESLKYCGSTVFFLTYNMAIH